MGEALFTASVSLTSILKNGLNNKIDPERMARVGTVSLEKIPVPGNTIFTNIADYIVNRQSTDGGWVDVEETAWSIAYLRKLSGEYEGPLNKGLHWLAEQRISGVGWGRNNRDTPRIPYTSWVAILCPELIDNEVLNWLEKACNDEIKLETSLTYKIALPILAFSKHRYSTEDPELINSLVSSLISSQNEDGGFAPWRDHPCGSDPWCTSVAALGLLAHADGVPEIVFERSLDWLLRNQLPNGMWPYHYIDEGTALAYWALKELLIYFKRKEH